MGIKAHPDAKALIFDLDGTLSDSLPVHVETWNKVGEKYGFIFDTQILHEMTGRPTLEFAKRVVSQYNLSESPEKIVRLKQESFWNLSDRLVPINEVVAIVKEKYGKIPMAVGTGASFKSTAVQLQSLKLTKYFNAIVTADDVIKHKPEPDTFLECARIMGVEPQFCQVFEDGDLGIKAAKSAGMMVTDVRPFIAYGEWMEVRSEK